VNADTIDLNKGRWWFLQFAVGRHRVTWPIFSWIGRCNVSPIEFWRRREQRKREVGQVALEDGGKAIAFKTFG
jgi:hypothetical protein